MDEVEAAFTQFDLPSGSLSCMPSSLCFARLFLDHPLDRSDMHRVLRAGAMLQSQWVEEKDASVPQIQCWMDTTRVFPPLVKGVVACFECNGFLSSPDAAEKEDDGETLPPGTAKFDTLLDELESGGSAMRTAGVITVRDSSYGLAHDGTPSKKANAHMMPSARPPASPVHASRGAM